MTTISDPSSCANFTECRVEHWNLKWRIDFKKRCIDASVELHFLAVTSTHTVKLDTKDLTIRSVQFDVDGEQKETSKVEYSMEKNQIAAFGSCLTVKLPQALAASTKFRLTVVYGVGAGATALQWMAKEQTADKKQPYLFSQCQAIHARSLLPCMDTPAVKQTYAATLSVPKEMTALMSAVPVGEPRPDPGSADNLIYQFEQKICIPSYLLAIVCGVLAKKDLSSRCAVWSEPSMVDAAFYEFGEAEDMLQAGESLLGDYVWGRYDILVLPPSFPYGGMENPCLTFVTPTVLAGERSLATVIAHELAHSWTGNLVTNVTWEHFWLNEGFTMFCERKILARLFSESYRQFLADSGYEGSLRYAVEKQFDPTHNYTRLVPLMSGVDPDDSFSAVPYEKGHTLLFTLEQKLGGPAVFDKFLFAYIDRFKYRSINTDQWKAYLYEYFADQKAVLDAIDWNAWLYTPGMPPEKPIYDQTLSEACEDLCAKWTAEQPVTDSYTYDRLMPTQKHKFLELLLQQPPLSHHKIEKLQSLYNLNTATNSEILSSWIRLCVKAKWEPIIDIGLKFVTEQGRMKFCRPIYMDMAQWDVSLPKARTAFEGVRNTMHPITASVVAKTLAKSQD